MLAQGMAVRSTRGLDAASIARTSSLRAQYAAARVPGRARGVRRSYRVTISCMTFSPMTSRTSVRLVMI
jgi:hypothetical protein